MSKRVIKINETDNVAVALCDLEQGEIHYGVTLSEKIPNGHKFAVSDIPAGGKIIKCGNPVASAKTDIPAGAHVHTHNAGTCLAGNLDYNYTPTEYIAKETAPRTVNVYVRENGEVGIRNELWIIPVTGCVNGQAELILKTFKNRFGTQGFDGAFAFTHPYGNSQIASDRARTRKVLQKIVRHPNAGGVLVVGLGDVNDFRVTLGAVNSERVKFLDCREVEDEIETGVRLMEKITETMKRDRREAADISRLKIGLKCGSSDNLSGITANPLVGRFADFITSAGGTAAFCEIPETFGAEQLIMNRAKDGETFEKIQALVNSYKDCFRENGRAVYENPSPERIADGITTIEEKAVACLQKSGNSLVQDVVSEKEFITQNGLNLLSGPDDDMCAVTNLAASGCHMVLFTTGRGNPFGGIVPTLKISSSHKLAEKKSNWIDFDAGSVLDTDYESQLEKLIGLVVAVAGVKLAKNEINNARGISITDTSTAFD